VVLVVAAMQELVVVAMAIQELQIPAAVEVAVHLM
jgi:hypothetical protein